MAAKGFTNQSSGLLPNRFIGSSRFLTHGGTGGLMLSRDLGDSRSWISTPVRITLFVLNALEQDVICLARWTAIAHYVGRIED